MERHGTSETIKGTVTQTITIPNDIGDYIIDIGNTIGNPTSTVTITNPDLTTSTHTITNSNDIRKIPIQAGATIQIVTQLKEGEGIEEVQVLKKEEEKTSKRVNEIETKPETEVKGWETVASRTYMYNNGGDGYWQKCLINETEVGALGIIGQGETKRIRVTYQVSDDGSRWSETFTNIQDGNNVRYLRVKVEYQVIEGNTYGDISNNKIKVILNDGSWTIDLLEEDNTLIERKRVYFAKSNKQGTIVLPEHINSIGEREFYSWKEGEQEYIPGSNYTATKDTVLKANYITPTISVEGTDIGQNEFTLEITTNYREGMVDKYVYYVSGKEPVESTLKTQLIPELTAQTTYQVYVKAYSKTGKIITSATKNITTLRLPIKVNSITLNKEEAYTGINQTIQLSVTAIGPEDADDKTYGWTSLNPAIATVTTSGQVKGIAAGEATIRCSSTDGGKSVDCKVTVVNGTTISNRTELEAINLNLSGSYILVADIDLSESNWTPIGSSSSFTGTLDGNGHTISNMTINSSSSDHRGFFYGTKGATIKNLKFENANVTGNQNCGVLLGRDNGGGTKVSQVAIVGGSVNVMNLGSSFGISDGGVVTLEDCYSTATLTYTDSNSQLAGLLFARKGSGVITNCYYAGNMAKSNNYTIIRSSGTLTSCYYNSDVCKAANVQGTARTTEQFAVQSNFSGFNFTTTWIMKNGRPELRIFSLTD